MNKSEQFVYNKLLKEGYKLKDIINNCDKRRSPDFILNDGREIEVKNVNNKVIIFTKEQKNLNEDCEIWIVINDICKIYKLKELKENPDFKVVFNENHNIITVQDETWRKLIELKYSLKKKSLGEVIKALLVDIHQEKKK